MNLSKPRKDDPVSLVDPEVAAIADIVCRWKARRDNYEILSKALELTSRKDPRKNSVWHLKEAHKALQKLAPLLRWVPEFPKITVVHGSPEETLHLIKITDLFAAGGLLRIASWLDEWTGDAGRRPQIFAAKCADELAQYFMQQTHRPQWDKVAAIVWQHFPSVHGKNQVDGGGNWIQNLVKRNRTRKKSDGPKGRKYPEGNFFPQATYANMQDASEALSTIIKSKGGLKARAQKTKRAKARHNQRIKIKHQIRKHARSSTDG